MVIVVCMCWNAYAICSHCECINRVLIVFLQSIEQSMKHLDMISPYETHKIGVIYIKPGQVCTVGILHSSDTTETLIVTSFQSSSEDTFLTRPATTVQCAFQ